MGSENDRGGLGVGSESSGGGDVLSRLPHGWHEQIQARKWTEKKEALIVLEQLLQSSSSLLPTPAFHDVMSRLHRCLSDPQVVIVGQSLKCLALLAGLLKKQFVNSIKPILRTLFEWFKATKHFISQPLNNLFDLLFEHVLDFSGFSDPLLDSLDSKLDTVSTQSLEFLRRCLSSPKMARTSLMGPNKSFTKSMAKTLINLLDHSSDTIRRLALETLAILTVTLITILITIL